ncbi:long chain acyl-CoA synthetase 4-like [Sesamum indicum]|uniref:Long-chain-fatty-acid--CoA ligase n=1 Tax=Sesamum indicum TaxID=4182 RepID=A0A6I9T2B9_SESIN|nr:long chain acyl-CoA synthetase 4-like [Sesamum indicum]XP_020548207.1 long chain acyl-CoA synthetase 4-like [Sesamum indicum]
MEEKRFIVEVEPSKPAQEGKPSIGAVYRSIFAKDGFPPPIPGLDSCWDIFRLSVEKYPENRMLGRREMVNGKPGKYSWMTYKEVYDIVLKVGNSIRSCGVEEGGHCGIYGANCPEWVMSMEACNAHGLYCVPLYDTLGAGAVEFIICHAEVTLAFVEEKKISELLKTFPGASKYLKTIVSFGKVTSQQKEDVEKFGVAIYSWDDFMSLGENKNFNLPTKKKTDICTIMYTSGTTGDPKGVMISNNSIVTLIAGVKHMLESVNEALTVNDVYLSYLPLAHIFDRVIEECFINQGAAIGFWRGDVKLLVEDIVELQPSVFCAVPRVLDRIYSGLQQKISSGGLIKQTAFNFSYSLKLRNMRNGFKQSVASPICDKLVFNLVKQGLGGNVRLILSGAAPLASHVEEYLRVVTCSYVLQGYGLTETCAGTFVSIPDEMNMLGTVGPPLPNVDVCLESVPEMGYDALSRTPRGEVCVRGDTLFSGYYKREDLTKEVLIDGWFHTGDIGEWQPNGSLKIIDRKKNIFKLSQGEYVAVENLENIYSLAPDIESIWVYGNSFESFLVAIINPNKQAVEQWAEQNGIFGNFNGLCENTQVKNYFLGELTRIAKEKKLKGFEFIKAIHLDPVPFDMERDLITPTYKKKRPQLLKYYQDMIDSMYKNAK